MTLEAVHRELRAFLTSSNPEVLCIRGRWGVGKTYQWNKILAEVRSAGEISLTRYSYVSLFGVNSLAGFRLSIFENQEPLRTGRERTTFDKLDTYMTSKVGWRQKTRFLSFVPGLSGLSDSEAAATLAALTTSQQLVCIDDLERRGDGLDLKDVLGLTSFLKEQRGCKVAIILNEEELPEEDQQDFKTNLEKVVDVSITFSPTPEEAASSAFDKPDEISSKVVEKCVKLGVTNIRSIRKIDRLARSIEPMLVDFSEEVFDAAISSIALFSWANDQPNEAPSLDYIKTLTASWAFAASDEEIENPSDEKVKWRAKLEEYGYAWTDEFDLALIDGVKSGYFLPEAVTPLAKSVNDRIIAAKADDSFEKAWEAYHGSFDDNADEVLDGIYESFKRNFHFITPLNANGTVTLLKELGRDAQAKELIDLYVDGRKEDRNFFDLNEYAFAHDIKDPDLRSAFDTKAASMKPPQDFKAALLSIKDGWGTEQLKVIASAPLADYIKTFKESSGSELKRLLSNAMQFARIVNPSEEMSIITSRTKEALTEIGKESPINAHRVKRFGVEVPQDDTKPE